jgi:hypothetical protein
MTERTIIVVAVLLAGVVLAMTWMVTTNDDEADRTYTDEDCYDRGLVPVSLWDPEGDVACDDPVVGE